MSTVRKTKTILFTRRISMQAGDVASAIGNYEESLRVMHKAQDKLKRARIELEEAVINQLCEKENDSFLLPCGEDDSLTVVCGNYQVVLHPADERPKVSVDRALIVE